MKVPMEIKMMITQVMSNPEALMSIFLSAFRQDIVEQLTPWVTEYMKAHNELPNNKDYLDKLCTTLGLPLPTSTDADYITREILRHILKEALAKTPFGSHLTLVKG